ncbi:MAG TPA: TPM domain-containing protein [Burkholderiales bacterium]|nr:TPM domain-containing protein [Burkholderiales bacterium]
MSWGRALRHLMAAPWRVRRAFPRHTLEAIEAAIGASERRHRGEIRFAVEGALEFLPVARGLTARDRALELFSVLKVWDTEENTGVLIYVQLIERDIEVVADRGISRLIAQQDWDGICRRMEEAFRAGRYEAGVNAGIAEVSDLLARHFPSGAANLDELPDQPVVL